jgi:hypothetical protein
VLWDQWRNTRQTFRQTLGGMSGPVVSLQGHRKQVMVLQMFSAVFVSRTPHSTGSIDWRAQCCSLNSFLAGHDTRRLSLHGQIDTHLKGGAPFRRSVPIICPNLPIFRLSQRLRTRTGDNKLYLSCERSMQVTQFLLALDSTLVPSGHMTMIIILLDIHVFSTGTCFPISERSWLLHVTNTLLRSKYTGS